MIRPAGERAASSTRINMLLADSGRGDEGAREALIPWFTLNCAGSSAGISERNVPTMPCKARRWRDRPPTASTLLVNALTENLHQYEYARVRRLGSI